MQLKGERVLLRKIEITDVSDEYLSWLNDDEVRKTQENPAPKPYTRSMLQDYLEKVILDANCRMFAMIDIESQKHIGTMKLHNFKTINGTCELGIMIGDKNFWGNGYGQESMRLLLHFGFSELRMRKIWMTVHANNTKMEAMSLKLGFVEEGRMRKHTLSEGTFVDKIMMGMFYNEIKNI